MNEDAVTGYVLHTLFSVLVALIILPAWWPVARFLIIPAVKNNTRPVTQPALYGYLGACAVMLATLIAVRLLWILAFVAALPGVAAWSLFVWATNRDPLIAKKR